MAERAQRSSATRLGENAPAQLSMTTQARVVEHIREEILSGKAPLGSRLLQNEVAARLQVSSTPVREAFRELAAEGLVKIDARRGAVVCEFDAEELLEVTELLALIEPANLLIAVPRLSKEHLEDAAGFLARMDRSTNVSRWVVLNRSFHMSLGRASERSRQLRLLSQLLDINGLFVRQAVTEGVRGRVEAQDQHRALFEACQAGDAHKAATLAREHIEPTLAHLREKAAGDRGDNP